MIQRTLEEYARAGKDGKHWYTDAWRTIGDLTPCGWTPKDFAAIVAITSPRVHVKKNISLALEFAELGRISSGHLPTVATALAKHVQTGDVAGPKVSAFYRALTGDHNAVVLDVWMARAFGMEQTDKAFRRVGTQEWMTQCVTRTAGFLGYTPRQTQACVWYGAMREAGRKPQLFSTYAKDFL